MRGRWRAAIDFEAEGLLDGPRGRGASRAGCGLLEQLSADGVPLEELRAAVEEARLAVLPVEHLLAGEPRFTLGGGRRAVGGPHRGPLAPAPLARRRRARAGRGGAQPRGPRAGAPGEVAAGLGPRRRRGRRARQDDRGLDVAVRGGLAAGVRRDLRRAGGHRARGRRSARRAVRGAAAAGRPDDGLRLPAAPARAASPRRLAVGGPARPAIRRARRRSPSRSPTSSASPSSASRFRRRSSVGVTGSLEEVAREASHGPVRLVKMIGDAAMLASPDTEALIEATFELVEGMAVRGEDGGELPAAPGRDRPRPGAQPPRRLLRVAGQPREPDHRRRPRRQPSSSPRT